jgi:large subunit ribosomal protein L22
MADTPANSATAKATYIRMTPRKVKIVLDLIRNQPVEKALAILRYTPKAACEPTLKLLQSAVANAENNFNLDPEKLYVSHAVVGQGPTLKRMRARSKGSGTRINKKTSHITLTVREAE